ncbi:GTPase domain-containing protein [Vibrio sp. 2-1(7)]|uniref:GTPase domain-containing protein n=1 Tax=Vibrio sp. 2-1(7) TaxID=2591011 RepID=UPI001482A329|nr:GTPase domain-containing protein [Vibrio sp. 2-1(7)]NNN64377.1 GTPase domain-containing protein [Vibrio sp. 2-1(7)]
MNSESWTDLVPTVAQPVVYAYQYRHAIHEHWIKALIKLGKGSADVIVTGRPGAGKSVLAAHYHGEANSLDWQLPGTSNEVEVKPITIGDWTKLVSVIPGQNNAERAKALDLALNSSDSLEGIIHVVDWGYTAVRDDSIRKTMVEHKELDSVSKVRDHNLQIELEEFKRLLESVKLSKSNRRGPNWIAIAVNKVDLYESSVEDAKQYYHPDCGSVFADVITELYQAIGKANIKVIAIPVCAQPEAFEWNGEKVTSQIDSVTKQRNYLRVFVDNMALLQSSTEK